MGQHRIVFWLDEDTYRRLRVAYPNRCEIANILRDITVLLCEACEKGSVNTRAVAETVYRDRKRRGIGGAK